MATQAYQAELLATYNFAPNENLQILPYGYEGMTQPQVDEYNWQTVKIASTRCESTRQLALNDRHRFYTVCRMVNAKFSN